ncbi:MAG: hypothetical protein ACE5Q6_20930, partial [Dehalococcoidia bacterium]
MKISRAISFSKDPFRSLLVGATLGLLLFAVATGFSTPSAQALIGSDTPAKDPSITIRYTSEDGSPLGGSSYVVVPNPFTCEGSLEIADNGSDDAKSTPGIVRMNEVCVEFDYLIQQVEAPEG